MNMFLKLGEYFSLKCQGAKRFWLVKINESFRIASFVSDLIRAWSLLVSMIKTRLESTKCSLIEIIPVTFGFNFYT